MIVNVSHLVYIIVSTVFSTLMVMLNIPAMTIFVRKMRLTSLSVLMLANVCACDMFVCIVSNNFYIFNISTPPYKWNTGPIMCKIFKTATMMMNISQILSLAILCHDRMRRLICPNINQWDKKHGIKLLCGVWSMAVVLTLPRLFIFGEQQMKRFSVELNTTEVWNYNCKPINTKSSSYITCTSLLFVCGYALPTLWIISTLLRCQWFTFKHERLMESVFHGQTSSPSMRMNRQLALTFNMLGVLYVTIWTPFFVMSLLDLQLNLLKNRDLVDLNFALRCTLLVLGSGKPIIYMAFLPKFRKELFAIGKPLKPVVRKSESRSGSSESAVTSTSGRLLSDRSGFTSISDIAAIKL